MGNSLIFQSQRAKMVQWKKLFGLDGSRDQHMWRDEARRLLPSYHEDAIPSAIAAPEVTKVALRLRYLIEECIPCELEETRITESHSRIITHGVIQAARKAGETEGNDYGSCVVYCLLVNKRWFKKQAMLELWDADLHNIRAVACEVIAKQLIETEDNQEYLLQDILLKRYSIMIDGEQTSPANVIERAVDLHALMVTGSSGYQNATQVVFSLIYLGLYTGAINTVNPTGDLDIVEIILYIFTFGFLCDEFSKFWKVGRFYLGFWNVFNLVLYALLTTSLVTRFIALSHPLQENGKRGAREDFNE